MRLSFIFLDRVTDVNNFDEVDELHIGQATVQNLYFRLVTLKDSLGSDKLRYIPATGAIIQASFNHIDSGKAFQRVATQPFAGDLSILMVQVLSTDKVAFNSVTVSLTEGSNTRTLLPSGILTQDATDNKRFYA
jgi:hypothetical protein